MANPLSAALRPRSNAQTDAAQDPQDLLADHEQNADAADSIADAVQAEGGDSGTKGTGSAG